jgi:hypothetical protein
VRFTVTVDTLVVLRLAYQEQLGFLSLSDKEIRPFNFVGYKFI